MIKKKPHKNLYKQRLHVKKIKFNQIIFIIQYRNFQYRVPRCRICSVPRCPQADTVSLNFLKNRERQQVKTFYQNIPLFSKINHKNIFFVIQMFINVFSRFVCVRIFCFCFIIFLLIYLSKL